MQEASFSHKDPGIQVKDLISLTTILRLRMSDYNLYWGFETLPSLPIFTLNFYKETYKKHTNLDIIEIIFEF